MRILRIGIVLILFLVSPVQAGLVGHWRFDDGTGATTTRDHSLTGATGTLTNMDASTDWVAGQVYGALNFDGTNDRVVVSSYTAFSGANSTAVWVRLADTNNRYVINVGANNVNWLEINTGGSVIGGPAAGNHCTTSSTVSTGVWTLLTRTFDGSTNRLYINTTEGCTSDATFSSPTQVVIGGNGALTNNNAFSGDLDDVRIYDHALSVPEITRLYTRGRMAR